MSDIPTVLKVKVFEAYHGKWLLVERSVILDVRLLLAEGMELRIKHHIGC